MQRPPGERPRRPYNTEDWRVRYPKSQMPITRRWRCKAVETGLVRIILGNEYGCHDGAPKVGGMAECDSVRIVLPVSVFVKTASGIRLRRNDDEDSIWHSGFIRQHSAGDCGGAKHCCAPGGTATEVSTRGGGADGSGRGCCGSALSVELGKAHSRTPRQRKLAEVHSGCLMLTRSYFLEGSSVPEGMRCTLSSPGEEGSTGAAMPRA